MGDPLKKVQSGQPLAIPASTFNSMIDAARAHRSSARQSGGKQTEPLRGQLVTVKNSSGADVGRFGVLGIDDVVFSSTDNLAEFQNNWALDCSEPATADHLGRFVVLAEPLASGRIGKAYVSGVCAVKIDVQDEDHTCADVNDGQAGSLQSGLVGAAAILWKEAGTGEKWAIVRFAGGDCVTGLFAVKVTEDGSGSAGSDTTLCTFKYTVDDLDGVELATSKAPMKWRNADTMYEMDPPADDAIGLAYYDEDEVLQLYDANEVPIIEGGSSGTGGTDVLHRIAIPDGSGSGTYTFDSGDWRGKVLLCMLQVVYAASPETVQWGGGATSGLTRFFGSTYSGADKSLVYVTGGKPAVVLEGGTGHLFWSWNANSSGNDLHCICRILASNSKTSPDHTV